MKAKGAKGTRPKLPPVSEEMEQWSAMLGEEIRQWPKVSSRPMFGFQCFYRGKKIFAALPATRGVGTLNTLMFRIKPMPAELLERAKQEPRIETESRTPGAKWFLFELSSSEDLRDVLWWLNQAYERAK